MKRLLLISLCGWFAVDTWAATNPVPLTATQVLDEFARTQDRLLSVAYTATTTEEVAKGNRFYVAEASIFGSATSSIFSSSDQAPLSAIAPATSP